ncbi:MAG: response regulator transcription factor [Oscillospiraceae bacterium]|nr:response regulator transcription factor [Oscillospiraceae bacterium]
MATILLVEDDDMIASGLEYALGQEGYAVVCRTGVRAALEAVEKESFSLGIIDLGLPDGTGFDVCRALRAKGTPVVFLTAVDDEANTVRGLEMGADDYITKPFRLRELIARVGAVLRRAGGEAPSEIALNSEIMVDPLRGKVYRLGAELILTALEYRLLLTFISHRGQVLSRTQLLEGIWDVGGGFVEDNTLTVYVRRLREKLGDDSQNPTIIKTVRGMGYRLD